MQSQLTSDLKTRLISIVQRPEDNPEAQLQKFIEIQNIVGLKCDLNLTLKKFRFLYYALKTKIHPQYEALHQMETLREFFFQEKGFTVMGPNSQNHIEALLIDQVLSRRSGHPLTIGFLFLTLARHLGLNAYFVHSTPQTILKFIHNGEPLFINLENNGHYFENSEVLKLLNQTCSDSPQKQGFFELANFEDLLTTALLAFEKLLCHKSHPQDLLTVYDILLELNPGNLSFLERRVKLCFELGDHQRAAIDLKRYFLISCSKNPCPELVTIGQSLGLYKSHPTFSPN